VEVMTMGWGRRTGFALAAMMLSFVVSAAACRAQEAERAAPKMWLACENGHNYPIRPIAVSREYDLVTGYLLNMGPRHAVHLRLVPMGVGYRYTGRGIWFDGLRGEAVLNWGTRNEVPCTVAQQ
jgi:hypothetical protein